MAFMMIFPAFLGWMFYGVLSLAIFRAKKTWLFVLLYTVLCLALAFNVAGCKSTIETVKGIH